MGKICKTKELSMNEIIKAMKERRSIRHYTTEAVDDKMLDAIIEAGRYAPSSFNNQALHITVLRNMEAIAKLDAVVKESTQKPTYNYFIDLVSQPSFSINNANAPVFIIVSVDPGKSDFPAEDGAMVMANILLASHSLGLGACWVKQVSPLSDEPDTRKVLTELGVPEQYAVIGCACVGHRGGLNPAALPRQTTVNFVE